MIMSKRLHLVCNAHLDPVWQWEWEEGAAEALSTFRIAADFCDEYDNFVFCHNEALLYRWIEEYDPELFGHIARLVKEGKWNIIGGWHLQPDCNMPSGEAMVRQILEGRKYFLEKFGVAPKTAVSFDAFGHNRGLVQILTKSGYKGYMFMRPNGLNVPANEFRWKGYDGSEVTAIKIVGGYNSGKGHAVDKIRGYIDMCGEDDFFLCTWGIGNHGGGPSKKDIEDINALTEEAAKSGIELVQSNPDRFLDEVNEKRPLPGYERSLISWAPGCYTSQVRVKQRYRAAENAYFMAEMMSSHAELAGVMKYPDAELAEALYDIVTVQFHDMLPGSSIQPAEEMILRMLDHSLEILSRVKARAFFALASGQEKAPSDRIPVFVYNPYPYEIEDVFRSEFMLWDQYWGEGFQMPVLYDQNGARIPVQCEKEFSTVPLEWRKRICFGAKLAPMSLNRFECAFECISEKPQKTLEHNDTHYIFRRGAYDIEINRATGLVDRFAKDGTDYTAPGAFGLEVWKDNYDPWYMESDSWREKLDDFRLLTPDEAMELCHTNAPIEAVHVIESGDLRVVLEAVFGYKSSRAIVKYYLSEKSGLSVDIRIVWVEKQLMVKLNVPSAFAAKDCLGEEMYGRERLFDNLVENVSQKYIALCGDELAIAAANNGIYGSSFDNSGSALKITLLRSPSYTAHPLPNRITMPQDRYMPYIEQGERDFSFRFEVGSRENVLESIPRIAQHFNLQPMALSFYPTGYGKKPSSPVLLEGDEVRFEAFKRAENGCGYIIRLFNPTEKEKKCRLNFRDTSIELSFGSYEIKTLRCTDTVISETNLCEGMLN